MEENKEKLKKEDLKETAGGTGGNLVCPFCGSDWITKGPNIDTGRIEITCASCGYVIASFND